jgi:hypothetical protein
MQQNNGQLPEVYVNESGANFVEPVYILHGACYLGDSHWSEGDRIVWLETPNQLMQPLNRAAQDAIARWLDTLPLAGRTSVNIRVEDLLEAANLIPEAERQKLDINSYGKSLMEIAIKLKEERDGRPGMTIPAHGIRTAAASSAPAMPNAMIEKQGQMPGFGQPGAQRASQKPGPARNTKAMANTPEPAGAAGAPV